MEAIPAKHKIGIAGDFANQTSEEEAAAAAVYSKRFRLPPERCWDHELEITGDFLGFLGVEVTLEDLRPEFWLSSDDLTWADSHIMARPEEVILGFSPASAQWWGRSYPPEKYEAVFRELGDYRFRVVFFGTAAENEFTRSVAKTLERCANITSVQNLVGQTTIRQMVAAYSKCDVILTMETAGAHIGVALNKPSVVIMGGGHYGRFCPWGDTKINRVARLPMDCYRCQWHCRYPTIRCIKEIPPTAVAQELRYILENGVG